MVCYICLIFIIVCHSSWNLLRTKGLIRYLNCININVNNLRMSSDSMLDVKVIEPMLLQRSRKLLVLVPTVYNLIVAFLMYIGALGVV